mmetsp:Transcript_15161/g.43485  ORF Transcript_15161/g.43485 Transcript_15161/m.43485 type:complete len:287 (-) Transcript_15161:3389-4249(-)
MRSLASSFVRAHRARRRRRAHLGRHLLLVQEAVVSDHHEAARAVADADGERHQCHAGLEAGAERERGVRVRDGGLGVEVCKVVRHHPVERADHVRELRLDDRPDLEHGHHDDNHDQLEGAVAVRGLRDEGEGVRRVPLHRDPPNPEAEGEPEQRHRAAHQREEAHVAGADRLADRNGHRVERVRVPPRSARLSLEDLGHRSLEGELEGLGHVRGQSQPDREHQRPGDQRRRTGLQLEPPNARAAGRRRRTRLREQVVQARARLARRRLEGVRRERAAARGRRGEGW